MDIKGEDIQERQFFLVTAAILAVICWSEILAICSSGNRLSTYTIALQNTSMDVGHKGVSVIWTEPYECKKSKIRAHGQAAEQSPVFPLVVLCPSLVIVCDLSFLHVWWPRMFRQVLDFLLSKILFCGCVWYICLTSEKYQAKIEFSVHSGRYLWILQPIVYSWRALFMEIQWVELITLVRGI